MAEDKITIEVEDNLVPVLIASNVNLDFDGSFEDSIEIEIIDAIDTHMEKIDEEELEREGNMEEIIKDHEELLSEDNEIVEEEKSVFVDKIFEKAKQLEEKISKKAGNKQGNTLINRLIEINKPKINWKKQLRKKMNAFYSQNASFYEKKKSFVNYPYNPVSRYGILGKHDIIQKVQKENIIIFAIDTSGSCFFSKQEVEAFFSEMAAAAKELEFTKKGRIFTIQWDYEIQEGLKPFKKNNHKNFGLKGGGGTDANCIFRYMDSVLKDRGSFYSVDKNEVKFSTIDKKSLPLLVILTDGYLYNSVTKRTLGKYASDTKNVLWFTRTADKIFPKENCIIYEG